METDENMKPKLEEMKVKLESLDARSDITYRTYHTNSKTFRRCQDLRDYRVHANVSMISATAQN